MDTPRLDIDTLLKYISDVKENLKDTEDPHIQIDCFILKMLENVVLILKEK